MNPCQRPGSGIWPDHHLKLPRVLTVLSLGFLPNLDIPLLPTHLTHSHTHTHTHTPVLFCVCLVAQSCPLPCILYFTWSLASVLSVYPHCSPCLEQPLLPPLVSIHLILYDSVQAPSPLLGGGLCRQPQSPLASPWQPILQHRARWWKRAHQRSVYATEISSKTQRLRTSYSYLCL